MPVYPETSSHLNNFTRAGTWPAATETHSADHGRIIGVWENVLHYGAKGDGTTDDSAAFAAAVSAISAVRGGVLIPPGSYKLASTVTVPAWVKIKGFGRNQVNINYTNVHAFTVATGTGNQWFENFTLSQTAGATSGSGIKVTDGSGVQIEKVTVNGVSTNTDPGIWLNGATSCHLDRLEVQGMTAPGIKMQVGGSFLNANTLYRSRVNSIQGSTNAAVYVEGSGNRIRDCVLEANRGYGLEENGGVWNMIEGNWFEDNSNHNVYSHGGASGSIGTQIVSNKFHYNHADIGTAKHIVLTSPSANGRNHIAIDRNIFQDSSASGVYIDIGTNVEHTHVLRNRGVGALNIGGAILDAGTSSEFWGNDSGGGNGDIVRLPWGSRFLFCNNGSPETVHAAPVGSFYLRSDGGAGTTLYVKESGTGNTGWVAK